jgi:hypothetical protein
VAPRSGVRPAVWLSKRRLRATHDGSLSFVVGDVHFSLTLSVWRPTTGRSKEAR